MPRDAPNWGDLACGTDEEVRTCSKHLPDKLFNKLKADGHEQVVDRFVKARKENARLNPSRSGAETVARVRKEFADAKRDAYKALAILGLQNLPAGPAECPVVCCRIRTKSKSQSSAMKRSAGAELGAAAKKPRSGAVSDGTAAPARLTSLSRGARVPEAQDAVEAAKHSLQWKVAQRLFKSVEAFILACILNRDTPGHITRELQEAAADWKLCGYRTARGPKRRKLNAVDGELDDRDIDPFLAQIVAILKHCWMSMA